jgi:hypothetical protein
LIRFQLFDIGASRDMRYMLKAEFYLIVLLNALERVLLTVIFLEICRILFRSAAKWSNKKHLLLVILISIIFIILSTIGLKIGSGHGIM